jgi:hypothetical protein
MATNTAFQIVTGGHAGAIVGSFELAMRHVAKAVAVAVEGRDADPVRMFGHRDDYEALAKADEKGSYFHRVRYALQSADIESLEILEHNLDVLPGRDGTVACFDVKDGFDPSFLVQAALYRADDTGDSPQEISDDLHAQIVSGVRSGRAFGEDEIAFVRRLRRTEENMGGKPLVPDTGDAAEILRDLPDLATKRFHDAFARAYPEEAASLAP